MPTSRIRRLPIIYGLLAVAALVLLSVAREQPLVFGTLRLDGLSLFFMLLVVIAPLLRWDSSPRTALLIALAVLALTSRLTPVIALAGGVAAAIAMPHSSRLRDLVAVWHIAAAIACLVIGYGLLATRGALWYDERNAGAALDSLAFWFVLLAAALPLWAGSGEKTSGVISASPLPVLFLYPLVRLYSLGPWNPGWALATALFGGALALRHAAGALVRPAPVAYSLSAMLAAMALASFGLSSGAGIAAGCYAALTSVLRIADKQATAGVGPLALVFVAGWMAVGAAVAGGIAALAGALWAAALLAALALTLRFENLNKKPDLSYKTKKTPLATFVPFVSSWFTLRSLFLITAILAPFVVAWLIEPAVAQLQGGLTPYGDIRIWPWIGLAFVNSAQVQIAVLPSVAVAVLMVVLVSIVFLLTRLRSQSEDQEPEGDGQTVSSGAGDYRWLWQILREEVPWLAGKRQHDTE